MQRKATRQSRGPNAEEKAHMCWIKDRGICAACNSSGGVILHHFAGSSAKIRVGIECVHYGHWAVNGLCQRCDDIVTHGTRKQFRALYGPEAEIWQIQAEGYPIDIPLIMIQAIAICGK